MKPERTSVLSIVGPGRSGTTILGNILGEVQGIVNAGEIRWLFQRGLLERRPCGCGLPPAECPRWSVVLDRWWKACRPDTAEDHRPEEIGRVLRAQRDVLARRRQPRAIASASKKDPGWEALQGTRAVTAQLCT